jgi:formiminotetrahydrofolate cyclodeaminase
LSSFLDLPARDLLDLLAAGKTTPGAGSAAAFTGALAGSLIQAAARYTVRGQGGFAARAGAILAEAEERSDALRRAVDEDAAAFERFWKAHKRGERDEAAGRGTVEIPLRIAGDCAALAELALELFEHGFRNARGESAAAALQAVAAGEAAAFAARLNLKAAGRPEDEAAGLLARLRDLRERIAASGISWAGHG